MNTYSGLFNVLWSKRIYIIKFSLINYYYTYLLINLIFLSFFLNGKAVDIELQLNNGKSYGYSPSYITHNFIFICIECVFVYVMLLAKECGLRFDYSCSVKLQLN